jgi:carbon storage regulator
MLVVTRKTGERVMVGDEVAVVVLDITSSHVRLGIEAPKTVAIHRGEVWDQIAEQNRQVVAETPARLPDPAE